MAYEKEYTLADGFGLWFGGLLDQTSWHLSSDLSLLRGWRPYCSKYTVTRSEEVDVKAFRNRILYFSRGRATGMLELFITNKEERFFFLFYIVHVGLYNLVPGPCRRSPRLLLEFYYPYPTRSHLFVLCLTGCNQWDSPSVTSLVNMPSPETFHHGRSAIKHKWWEYDQYLLCLYITYSYVGNGVKKMPSILG